MSGDWTTYDWRAEGVPATFTVDMQYAAPPAGYDTLLWFSCESLKKAPLSARDSNRAQAFLRASRKQLRETVYVGCVCAATWQQHYFYTADARQIDVLEALCVKEKHLALECGRAAEPDWSTYAQFLYPDTAKLQTVINGRQIDAYASRGDNLKIHRRLNLSVGFPKETFRLQFEEQARLEGFAIGNPWFSAEHDTPYGSTLHVISSLEKPAVDEITTRIIDIASRFGGRLFHWDCPFVPKRGF